MSKLTDDGIVINEPNIFFNVEKSTGISKIILGDLSEIGYALEEDEEILSKNQILANNKYVIDGHMSRLKSIMLEKTE